MEQHSGQLRCALLIGCRGALTHRRRGTNVAAQPRRLVRTVHVLPASGRGGSDHCAHAAAISDGVVAADQPPGGAPAQYGLLLVLFFFPFFFLLPSFSLLLLCPPATLFLLNMHTLHHQFLVNMTKQRFSCTQLFARERKCCVLCM